MENRRILEDIPQEFSKQCVYEFRIKKEQRMKKKQRRRKNGKGSREEEERRNE